MEKIYTGGVGMIRAENFKNNLKDKEGIGTDTQGTMPFNTRFEEVERREKEEAEKNKVKKPPIGFKRRKISFSKNEIPFILLFLLGGYMVISCMANGKFGEMFMGVYLMFLTLFFYNAYPSSYTKNMNLLTWNVTTTLSAYFKNKCYGLYIRGRKMVLYFGAGLLIANTVAPFLNGILFLGMVFGSVLLFSQKETNDLYILFRAYGLISIGILMMKVMLVGTIDPFHALICLLIYTISNWLEKIRITEPISQSRE